MDDNGGGSERGKAREAPVVEALKEQGQVGKGVVDSQNYLRGSATGQCNLNHR